MICYDENSARSCDRNSSLVREDENPRHFDPVFCLPLICHGQETSTAPTDQPVETFYQQVDIQRFPEFVVQGLNVNQQLHYRITSSFEVFPPNEKGKWKATQTITDTELVEADALSQAVFTQSLAEMRGQSFTYELDRFSEVIAMDGHRDNTKAVAVEKPKSKGMLVSNVIDKDGWKELAQLTLFQPPNTGSRSPRTFTRKTTHDWGGLGSWYGKTTFVARSARSTRRATRQSAKQYTYEHELQYTPPAKDQPQQGNGLPFEVNGAAFRAYEAWGEILYDVKQKRVMKVRELFHARGSVNTTMLGVASTVDIDEKQIFMITVTPQRVLKVK